MGVRAPLTVFSVRWPPRNAGASFNMVVPLSHDASVSCRWTAPPDGLCYPPTDSFLCGVFLSSPYGNPGVRSADGFASSSAALPPHILNLQVLSGPRIS